MQLKRLYYNNSYLRHFDALVVNKYTDSTKVCIVLDKTAFYPSSGGQPGDTGTIAENSVIDVYEREDGEVIHVLSPGSHIEAGSLVNCEVDWPRRFLYMQQHTGQHILSGVFLEKFSLQTVGFHIGKDFSTIDIDVSDFSSENISQVETRANEIVFENRPVSVTYLSQEEAKKRLRRDVLRSGLKRVIEIKDFDFSACGGTHCKFTGEVGLIVIRGWEKIKSNLRIEFYCGFRALNLFRDYNSVFRDISARFSVGCKDLVFKMDKLISENKVNLKELKSLKDKYIKQEIELIYNSANFTKSKFKFISNVCKDKSAKDLKLLAKSVINKYDKVIICLATAGDPSNLILARTDDLEINLTEIMQSLKKDFSGKGGGRADFFQGGGYKLKDIKKIQSILNNIII